MKNCSSTSKLVWLGFVLFGILLLQVSSASAQACTGNDPSGQPAATGLYAEYFTGYFNDDLGFFSDNRNPAGITRIESQVNFPDAASFGNLLAVSLGSATDADSYSLRMRGSVLIPTTGEYTFYLTSDDAAYIWLDGEALLLPPTLSTALIDNGGNHTSQTRERTITLTAGRHNVLVLYGDDCCDNVLVWEYSGPGISRQVIPSAAFCTAQVSAPLTPRAITYSPLERAFPSGGTGTSAAPTVQNGSSAVTGYALANAATLPAGISINATSGVISATATVPQGQYNIDVAVTNAVGTSTFRNAFRFQVTTPLPSGCGGLNPGGEPTAAGLYAEYFAGYYADNPAFFTGKTPGIIRTEVQLNFSEDDSFGNLLPVAEGTQANPENFSVRLRGSIYLAATGTYTFYLTADDAAYMWLDNAALEPVLKLNEAVINNGGLHLPEERSVTLKLSAGLHNIAFLYGDLEVNNQLVLEYASPGLNIARQVVPTSVFCSSTQPLQALASALTYVPNTLRMPVGRAVNSGLPTTTSASEVVQYTIANAAALPAGITINPDNGRLTIGTTVPEGTYSIDVAARNGGGTAVFAQVYSVQVVAVAPLECRGLDAGGGRASSGLYAEFFQGYFDKLNFFNNNPAPVQTRLTQALNYTNDGSWGDLTGIATSTSTEGSPDDFTVRFRGRISIPVDGTYTFYLTSDDASYMWLDNFAIANNPTAGNAFIDNGGQHLQETVSKTVTLTAGLHDVLIVYGDDGGLNVLRLEYSNTAAGIARQVVPAGRLCTSTSNAPLPVTLTRFGAQAEAAGVAIRWETAQEVNSAAFVVERSVNGQVFEPVGEVAAAGNSQRQQVYSFLDRTPFAGLSYYRLRQVDLDGSARFSEVVSVRKEGAANAGMRLALFPNPTPDGACTIRLEQPTAEAAELQVLDLTGRVVYAQKLPASSSTEHTLRPGQLAPGVYMVRLASSKGIVTQRLEIRR
ncbi:PA14 domain-containing protein [Hymenobacter seoulensis]